MWKQTIGTSTHTPNSVCKNNKILNEEWSFDFCYNTKRIDFFSFAWHTYPGSKPILEDGDSIGTRASGTPRIGTTRRMVTSFPACNLHSNDVILFIANNKIQCLTSLNRHNPLEFTFYAFPSSLTLWYHVFIAFIVNYFFVTELPSLIILWRLTKHHDICRLLEFRRNSCCLPITRAGTKIWAMYLDMTHHPATSPRHFWSHSNLSTLSLISGCQQRHLHQTLSTLFQSSMWGFDFNKLQIQSNQAPPFWRRCKLTQTKHSGISSMQQIFTPKKM